MPCPIVYLRGNHDDILERFLPIAFGKIRFTKELIHFEEFMVQCHLKSIERAKAAVREVKPVATDSQTPAETEILLAEPT